MRTITLRVGMSMMLWAGVLSGVVSPQTAIAEDDDYSRPGVYLGGGFTYAIEDFALGEAEAIAGANIDTSNSLGFHARAGYRVNRHVAGELLFEYYDSFEFETAGVEFAEAEGWSLSANGKLYLVSGPFRFQPYALLGLGVAKAEIKDTLGVGLAVDTTEFIVRFGGGLDLYATRNVVLNFEAGYILPAGSRNDLEDFPAVSLMFGAQYRFD